MTKGVKIALSAAVALFLGALIAALIINRPAESTLVDIVQDGAVIRTIDLSSADDQVFVIDYPGGGYNTVTVSGGTISITEADCPDQTCIHTGKLHSEDVPIVCLPHRLLIRYRGE